MYGNGRHRIKDRVRKASKPIHLGRICRDCGKYSKKTFYCTKQRKVLDENRSACPLFTFRRGIWGKRKRKYF